VRAQESQRVRESGGGERERDEKQEHARERAHACTRGEEGGGWGEGERDSKGAREGHPEGGRKEGGREGGSAYA